jgi:3-mercaptopropionate dioxygenase
MSTAVADIVKSIRPHVGPGLSAARTAEAVASALRAAPPSAEALLSAEQRRGSPDGYTQHVLHVEPGGSFSVVALVWRPGQETPVHDHRSWCVVAVLSGEEEETVYQLRDDRDDPVLVPCTTRCNRVGAVCACVPPGDIHRVSNVGDHTAVSLHVYGADIQRYGSSIRRCYDLPVAAAA